MHTSCFSIALLAAFAATAVALPAPSASIDVTTSPTPAPGQAPKSLCVSANGDSHINWAVYIANTTMPSDQNQDELGGGLIDNLRGRGNKCNPVNWQAQDDGLNPKGVAATFTTDTDCEGFDVAAAIMVSSSENNAHVITPGTGQVRLDRRTITTPSKYNIHCDGDTNEAKVKKQQKDLNNFFKFLGGAGQLLSDFAATVPKKG